MNTSLDSHKTIHTHLDQSITAYISLETTAPGIKQTIVQVTLHQCRPGMLLVDGECTCIGDYGGRLKCNQEAFRTELQQGAWIGVYQKRHLVASDCPFCSSISNELYFDLPDNVSDLGSSLCGKIHREAVLCGWCWSGYGPAVNSHDFACMECSDNYIWAYYLLTEFLPITLLLLVVIFFNIKATSAPINSFVFFAQVFPVAFAVSSNDEIMLRISDPQISDLKHIYTLLFDLWNLNIFRPLLPKYCLSPNITTLQLISTGYVTAVYPLILILVVYRPICWMLTKFRCAWNIQQSLIDAFATFLLLAYTKFALVSFKLLMKTTLVDAKGDPIGPGVVYFDGTVDYLSQQHMPYVVIAVAVLVLFVAMPPLLLSLPSLEHNLQKFTSFRFEDPIWNPGPLLQQFSKSFHGCYKDGTRGGYDHRWFAGLYFALRVVLFAVYPLTDDRHMFLQCVCLTGIFLFTALRPYKKDIYNKVDAAMFCLLLAINMLTNHKYTLFMTKLLGSNILFIVQHSLITLPLLYISVILVAHLSQEMWSYNSLGG